MRLLDVAWTWGSTLEERRAEYPCDRYVAAPYRAMWRAVDVAAPAGIMYRWVCQTTVAPYSYDLLDNLGRRSPRHLTPGADRLVVGQHLLVGEIVEFEEGRHVTVAVRDRSPWTLGVTLSVTYLVRPTGPASSRLVVKGDLAAAGPWAQALRYALVWGDLIMMRKQLLTLKELAELTAHDARELAGLV
jgi:hypothetical protein